MNELSLKGLTLLLLEDEAVLRKRVAAHLERLGMELLKAGSLAEARRLVATEPPDLALVDLNLPDGLGTDLLRERMLPPTVPTLVMTAEGGVAAAVESMRLGAADYLVKPFDLDELGIRLRRAVAAARKARVEEHRNAQESGEFFHFGAALEDLRIRFSMILEADRRVSTVPSPVLIEGETGTGKTSLARLLHRSGPRAAGPLVEVNCSALSESLAESELFGHERGAFTDAREARLGLFEAAEGGSLFLDELPSLSPALQAKILTAIEDHSIRRVGASRARSTDVRIIAATNADLPRLVREGRFREDLFHRLDLFRLRIPPLRERGGDVLVLADKLLEKVCRRYGRAQQTVPESGCRHLLAHAWPGNVRELAHEIERAVVFGAERGLEFEHLGNVQSETVPTQSLLPAEGFSLERTIDSYVRQAMRQSEGNVSAAARLLGVTRDYVRYRLKQLGEDQGTS